MRRLLKLHAMPENTIASGSASNHPTEWLNKVLLLQAPVTPDFGCCCLS